jgi:hypothetical protein
VSERAVVVRGKRAEACLHLGFVPSACWSVSDGERRRGADCSPRPEKRNPEICKSKLFIESIQTKEFESALTYTFSRITEKWSKLKMKDRRAPSFALTKSVNYNKWLKYLGMRIASPTLFTPRSLKWLDIKPFICHLGLPTTTCNKLFDTLFPTF